MMLRRLAVALLTVALLLPPNLAQAGPALVFEPYNGTVFYAEDPDVPWFPASLTKLMTAYIAFSDIRAGRVTMDTRIYCSAHAAAQAPTKLGLPVGGDLSLEIAIKIIIANMVPWSLQRSPSSSPSNSPSTHDHHSVIARSNHHGHRYRQH